VGIDVHKRTYAVVVRVQGREVKRWTTAAAPQQLGQQLHKFFTGAQIESAYEAGFRDMSCIVNECARGLIIGSSTPRLSKSQPTNG
jgi:hypothetical protein